jgi:hypothetical protein
VIEGAREQGRGVGGPSARAASRLAWSLCLLCLALLAARVVLLFLNRATTLATGGWGTANYAFILLVVILAFTLVGALISSRLPTNPIGWICLAIGLILALEGVADGYYVYALQTRPGSLPGGEYMAWLGNWLWVPSVFLIGTFMVLLFPDGRLPSRRWRVVAWLSVAALISISVSYAFFPGRLDEAPNVTNPLGIESAGSALEFVYTWDLLLLLPCFVAAAISMVLRFRHATGEVRQQIKWFAAAAVLQTMAFSFYFVVSSGVIEDFVALTFAGLPVAVGIAILRHRLYDIDVVINRTLVYGSLTAMLVAVYFGGVATTQVLFRALTGQEQQPQLAVVVSTLLIAALFNPFRRRIQSFIDRRFYRRKYDAAKALEAFSAKLRDETDLDALSAELEGVVRETMQPAHVSLWLRPESASRRSEGRGQVS